jgi:hypothetical protein
LQPIAWRSAILSSVGTLITSGLIIAGLVYAVRQLGLPLKFALMLSVLVLLVGIGRIVDSIYRTWAVFSAPLEQQKNVVVKIPEKIMLALNLALLAIFTTLLASAGASLPLATAALIALGGGAFVIHRYRSTVARSISNPIDIAPIAVDPAEKIELSVAGIMRIGSILDKGFNQKFLYWVPTSGRRLNPTAQNALLATDKRLYFIFVPIGLSDQTVANTGALEFALGAKYIQAKLQEMLHTMSLDQIYQSNPINFALNFSDVGRVEVKKTGFLNRRSVRFYDMSGGKLTITVRNEADLDNLEQFLRRGRIAVSVVAA